jgi:polar amino acid transport system substrate-binding protein
MKRQFRAMLIMAACTSLHISAAAAKEVRIMFGLTIPPYVIKEQNSGFELEIIREALAEKGHKLNPVYGALSLKKKMLDERQVDGAQHGGPEMADRQTYHYSQIPAVSYQDYAISLKKNNLAINTVQDLKDKSVAAYQTATTFIGPEYAAAVSGNPKYQETSNQKRQPLMLYAGGIDVIVMDINIFKYFKRDIKSEVDTSQDIVYHKIFQGSDTVKTNYPVFTDKAIRDDFEAGLRTLHASGRYQQIIDRYIAE